MVITIDGLSINGKSTLASMLAKELGFVHINSGALYRAMTLYILKNNLNINNINDIINELKTLRFKFDNSKILLNDEDITDYIKTDEISYYSAKWAGEISEFKSFVTSKINELIMDNNIIIDGRDVGTRVLPNADIKFYLYSDFDKRVERLWNMDKSESFEKVKEELLKRDDLDINGGNLVKPDNAIEIDVTNYSIDEVFNIMLNVIKKH